MTTRILAIATLMLLCACSRQAANESGGRPAASAVPSQASVARVASQALAYAPDQGRLLGYAAQGRSMRQVGEARMFPVDPSEEHALTAIGPGKVIHFTAPDGRGLDYAYQRHVEHTDGSWTWVGRLVGGVAGQESVLTFGEKAVFGFIPQGDGLPNLRLTTASDGRVWLMEAAHVARPEMQRIDDSPVPQRPQRVGVVAGPDKAAAQAMADGVATVDVLVGYTYGFASGLGGASQALTRLNFLFEFGNQSHGNAQSNVRLRMAHAMAVDYPDNTDNGDTLEALTGQNRPRDSRFNALLGARESYGADLVSLVRKFNHPENDGCGIAWLLGGGQSPIDPGEDANWAFSVISDGEDRAGNSIYYCDEETLVHELGHNLGQTHDMGNASGPGAHAYSYGEKVANANRNFYTVMAYGDSGQTLYNTFSNPDISMCQGPCGVANQKDSARSLRQTGPLIAQFRPTVVPEATRRYVRNDIDGDGRSDLILTNGSLFAYWLMSGSTVTKGVIVGGAGGAYRIEFTGDFNGDGRADVVYRNPTTRNMWLWTLGENLVSVTAREIGTPPAGWTVFAAADVDGDGKSDLLLRNGAQVSVWKMNGNTVASGVLLGSQAGYLPVGAGDFDGDGKAEILLRNPETRRLQMWFVQADWSQQRLDSVRTPEGWTLFSIQDVDGDGRDDLLNRQGTALSYWRMNGTALLQGVVVGGAPGSYVATRSGDFDGDGKAEVIYQAANRNMWRWTMPPSGGVASVSEIGTPASGWTVMDWPGVVPAQ